MKMIFNKLTMIIRIKTDINRNISKMTNRKNLKLKLILEVAAMIKINKMAK